VADDRRRESQGPLGATLRTLSTIVLISSKYGEKLTRERSTKVNGAAGKL
jgi:hypothetical protein